MSITILGRGADSSIHYGKTDRSVMKLKGGTYIVSYKWPYVEERYGKLRKTAVPTYMKDKGIIPQECARGVLILRGGETEGGGGWAEFRCDDAKE